MIIKEELHGQELTLDTGNYYFSPTSIDKGTSFMLSKVTVTQDDKALDLGCGYGIVGIWLRKCGCGDVVMCDISEEGVELSRSNLERNGIEGIRVIKSDGLKEVPDSDFTLILSNPPYHTDFSVAKSFIEDGFRKLSIGGRMIMVTKRLDWYKNKLTSVFGGVRVFEQDGYFVFISEKRSDRVVKKKKEKNELSKKLQRKQQRSGRNKKKI